MCVCVVLFAWPFPAVSSMFSHFAPLPVLCAHLCFLAALKPTLKMFVTLIRKHGRFSSVRCRSSYSHFPPTTCITLIRYLSVFLCLFWTHIFSMHIQLARVKLIHARETFRMLSHNSPQSKERSDVNSWKLHWKMYNILFSLHTKCTSSNSIPFNT